jgi:hypothetical protein
MTDQQMAQRFRGNALIPGLIEKFAPTLPKSLSYLKLKNLA